MGEHKKLIHEWLSELLPGRDFGQFVQEIADEPADGDDAARYTFILHTESGEYHITATEEHGKSQPYLGCVFVSRTYEPGENWMRGGDMWDGKFSHEMFLKIMHDILFHELLRPKPGVERMVRHRKHAESPTAVK